MVYLYNPGYSYRGGLRPVLFQLPGPAPPDPPPLHSIPPPALHPPLSEVEARRGFQRMMRNTITTRAPRPIAPSEVIDVEDYRGKGKKMFFLSGCCMAQRRFVVRAVALLSAKTK